MIYTTGANRTHQTHALSGALAIAKLAWAPNSASVPTAAAVRRERIGRTRLITSVLRSGYAPMPAAGPNVRARRKESTAAKNASGASQKGM